MDSNYSNLTPLLFPTAEDDQFEFKSSLTTDEQIKGKLPYAVSAIANSGGGIFFWGLDDSGNADGGVSPLKGNKSRRDWLDNLIHQHVKSTPRYQIKDFDDCEGRGHLDAGKVIVAVIIPESATAPHVAPDGHYYIRAGAHTVRAPHFVVESIFSRRQVGKPVISHVLRHKPDNVQIIQLGVIALTDAPALDVQISFEPLKKEMVLFRQDLPIQVPVVDRSTAFYMDVTTMVDVVEELGEGVALSIKYRDLMGNEYTHTNSTPLAKALPPIVYGIDNHLKNISKHIEDIKQAIDWARLTKDYGTK
jgi:hypothetical protein